MGFLRVYRMPCSPIQVGTVPSLGEGRSRWPLAYLAGTWVARAGGGFPGWIRLLLYPWPCCQPLITGLGTVVRSVGLFWYTDLGSLPEGVTRLGSGRPETGGRVIILLKGWRRDVNG